MGIRSRLRAGDEIIILPQNFNKIVYILWYLRYSSCLYLVCDCAVSLYGIGNVHLHCINF